MCIFREEIGGKGRVVALSCTVDIVCLYHYNIYICVCVCVCVKICFQDTWSADHARAY